MIRQEENADHEGNESDSQPSQQDRYVEGHASMKDRTARDCNSMQLPVDVLGELARDPLNRRQVVDTGIHHPAQPTEARE